MLRRSSISPSEQRVSLALKSFVSSALEGHGHKVLSIVLFGSRARGDYTHYSDADVLVILSESEERFVERLSEFMAYCPDGMVEPVVYTRDEAEAMFESRNPFLLDALHEGIPLFDRGFWRELKARFEQLMEEGLIERLGGGWMING